LRDRNVSCFGIKSSAEVFSDLRVVTVIPLNWETLVTTGLGNVST